MIAHILCSIGYVIGELTVCFSAAKEISDSFSCLWNYQKMSTEKLKRKTAKLIEKFSKNFSSEEDVVQKLNHITMIHNVNFGRKQLGALELLNALAEYRLENIFPNLSISLRMFLAAPATVASAKRSFSKFKLIRHYFRCNIDQDRLTNLAGLSIESDIAKQIDSDSVVCSFAKKKVCKPMLFQ